MFVESFNNVVKNKTFKRKQNKRVDVWIYGVIDIEKNLAENYEYKVLTEQPTVYDTLVDNSRHVRGMQIPSQDVPGKWPKYHQHLPRLYPV